MRVLVVAYKFGTKAEIGKNLGSYDYFLSQLIALRKRGIAITVLAPWLRWFSRGSTAVGDIPVVRYWPKLATRRWRNLLTYKLINRVYIWRTAHLIEKLCRDGKFDVLYVRQARESGAAAVRAKPSLKIPMVFQPITTWQWHFEKADDSIWRRLVKDSVVQQQYSRQILQNFDYFITYNEAMRKEYVESGADANKFVIIPGAVEHKIFRPPSKARGALRREFDLPADKKLILYIGRINFSEKGLDYLLRAMPQVLTAEPTGFLVMIGPATSSEQQRLQGLIGELRLGKQVAYLGSKAYRDLPAYINAADVGVVPSVWFESSGRVSLDMLSCGLPVVVTDTGGLAEYSVDGSTGLVVRPKDSGVLAEGLSKILGDDSLREEMSKHARRHVLDSFTLPKTTDRFVDFFQQITKTYVRD